MDIRPLIDDDELEIQWLDGRSDRLIVSFTGIGYKDRPVSGVEFPQIASQGGENKVVFVSDRKRSWYNRPGLPERVVETVRALAAREGVGRVATLGNSMGGYGAVFFANRLGAELAISFVPQFTMDDRVMRERRWQVYKREMTKFQARSLAECMGGPCRFFVLHGGRGQDRRHYRRFPLGPNIDHYVLPLKTHAAASRMREAGTLDPLIAALLAGDEAAVARIMAAEGAHRRDAARRFERLHMWAAGQSTRLGHRIASRLVAMVAPPVVGEGTP